VLAPEDEKGDMNNTAWPVDCAKLVCTDLVYSKHPSFGHSFPCRCQAFNTRGRESFLDMEKWTRCPPRVRDQETTPLRGLVPCARRAPRFPVRPAPPPLRLGPAIRPIAPDRWSPGSSTTARPAHPRNAVAAGESRSADFSRSGPRPSTGRQWFSHFENLLAMFIRPDRSLDRLLQARPLGRFSYMIHEGHDVGKRFHPASSFGFRHGLQVLDDPIQQSSKLVRPRFPLRDEPQHPCEGAALFSEDLRGDRGQIDEQRVHRRSDGCKRLAPFHQVEQPPDRVPTLRRRKG